MFENSRKCVMTGLRWATVRCGVLLSTILLASCVAGHVTPAEYIERAKLHQSKGELNAAVIELKNALKAAPQERDARRLLGEVYLALEDGASAEKELRLAAGGKETDVELTVAIVEALLQQSKFREIHDEPLVVSSVAKGYNEKLETLLGVAYLEGGQADLAEARFDRVLAQHPSNSRAKLGKAKAAMARLDVAVAESLIDQVLADPKPDLEGSYLKALVRFHNRDLAAAEKYSRQVIDEGPVFITSLSFSAKSLLVSVYLAEDNLDKASAQVDELVVIAPEHPVSNFLKGLTEYERRNYSGARDALLKVLKLSPDHKPTALLLGAVHYALGSYEQAEMYLGKYAGEAAENVTVGKLLGATRIHLQKPKEALAVLDPLLKLAPEDVQLLAMVGKASLGMGKVAAGRDLLEQALDKSKGDLSLRTELAAAYLADNNYDAAIQQLDRATRSGEAGQTAEYLLIVAHVRKQDMDSAIKIAREAAERHAEDLDRRNTYGSVLALAGKADAALEQFDAVLRLKKDHKGALLGAAQVHQQQNNDAQAKALYQRLLAQDDKSVPAYLGLAHYAARESGNDAAKDWLEKARRAVPDAVAPRLILGRFYLAHGEGANAEVVVQEILQVVPEHALGTLLLSTIQAARGATEHALKTAQRVATLYPDFTDAHYQVGRLRLALDDTAGARTAFAAALKTNERHFPTLAALALVEAKAGKSKQVGDLLDQVEKFYPEVAARFELQGDVYREQKQYEKALAAYAAAAARVDGDAASQLKSKHYETQVAAGRMDEAVAFAREWVATSPADMTARLALANGAQSLGRFPEAAEHYQRVLAVQPSNIMAINNLALVYLQQGDSKAVETAQRAVEKAPENIAVLDTAGWILVKSGKVQEGFGFLEKALDRAKDHPTVRFHYAYAAAKSGRPAQAKTMLQSLLKTNTAFEGKEEAVALLATL